MRKLSVPHSEAPLHQGGFGAPAPLRVVVAGAGVGGLETLVALRGLVGPRVALTLIAPDEHFSVLTPDAFEPFGRGTSQHHPLVELAADLDATFLRDAVAGVERDERTVRLDSGARVAYDVLVLAVGASPHSAFEYGLCFERAHVARAFDEVFADLRAERAPDIAIVVPPGTTWTLPAYELALMVAAVDRPPHVTLVTHEDEPLEAFGPPATTLARGELAAAGVRLLSGVHATVAHPNVVAVAPGVLLYSDLVVHLAALAGPGIAGVACDGAGYVLVDDVFRARGRRPLRDRRRDRRRAETGRAGRAAGRRGRRAHRPARRRRARPAALPTRPARAAAHRPRPALSARGTAGHRHARRGLRAVPVVAPEPDRRALAGAVAGRPRP